MRFMDEREKNIARAAIQVFMRYGFKRTTMNDIAAEAGVVRQTLYNIYANKNDVLQAVIRWHTEMAVEAIAAEISNIDGLGDQFDIVFSHMVIQPFEQMNDTPHADDIINGVNEMAKKEIEQASEQYRQIILEILTPYEKQIKEGGVTAVQFADMLQRSAKAFKHEAKSKKHLQELLKTLKASISAVTGAA